MTDPIAPEPAPAATPAPAYAAAPAAGPRQALSLTSFILGIAGVVFSWIPGLGFLASLAAIILGFIARKKEPAAPSWMRIVGIITGFVGILIGIISLAVLLFVTLIPLWIGSAAVVGNGY